MPRGESFFLLPGSVYQTKDVSLLHLEFNHYYHITSIDIILKLF